MNRRLLTDLAIGIRLAVGGGRTSVARLALSTMGMTLAVAVLLVAACAGTMWANHDERLFANFPTEQKTGPAPTYYLSAGSEYRGDYVTLRYLHPSGPDSPKPVGLPALPEAGEMYASPALAALLASPDGDLLRERVPERVVGILEDSMVVDPDDLVAWVGVDATLAESAMAQPVYGFAPLQPSNDLHPGMLALVLIGVVALLLPVFVFVSSASRIAGAERDRRLSAMRLVGAGAGQVRWIAAAEALVSAVAGLVLGTVVFLVARQFAEDVRLFDQQAYVEDLVPDPLLVVVVMAVVPVVSVLTMLVAQRRTVIEPLGVVRRSNPIRRRGWWRLAVCALGAVLLLTQLGARESSDLWVVAVVSGAVLMLLGVQVVLPWLVERVAGQVKNGPSSWVLAIRRLQLDSGTAARVVGGVAVVLAATITVQTMLLSMSERSSAMRAENRLDTVEIVTEKALGDAVLADVASAEGVKTVHPVEHMSAYLPGRSDSGFGIAVVDCAGLEELGGLESCADGDVFVMDTAYSPLPSPGTDLEFREYTNTVGEEWDPQKYEVTGRWQVPASVEKVTLRSDSPLYSEIYVTPGALGAAPAVFNTTIVAQVGRAVTPDQLEGIRNAVADYRWRVSVYSYNTSASLSAEQTTFVSIRNALYAGSIFTLMLAGVSMLVLALEHIRERRRSLAVLAATGVPPGVLGRSLLWQVALPIVLGVVVALAAGLGLAGLMLRLTGAPMRVDWPGVLILCGGATALTLLVSAMTLPFLKNATRLTTLRAE